MHPRFPHCLSIRLRSIWCRLLALSSSISQNRPLRHAQLWLPHCLNPLSSVVRSFRTQIASGKVFLDLLSNQNFANGTLLSCKSFSSRAVEILGLCSEKSLNSMRAITALLESETVSVSVRKFASWSAVRMLRHDPSVILPPLLKAIKANP